jgi:hypothetical protein
MRRKDRNGLAYKRPAEHPMIETYESQAPEEIRYFDDFALRTRSS